MADALINGRLTHEPVDTILGLLGRPHGPVKVTIEFTLDPSAAPPPNDPANDLPRGMFGACALDIITELKRHAPARLTQPRLEAALRESGAGPDGRGWASRTVAKHISILQEAEVAGNDNDGRGYYLLTNNE